MRRPMLLLAIPLLCAAARAEAADEGEGARKTRAWGCEGLAVVTSQVAMEEIELFLPERTVKLPLVPSASGAKYQGEGVLFWTKGDEQALLELAGEVHRCSFDAARSIWEDARRRGVEFRGLGQEPGWLLEIEAERIVFLYDYGTRRLEVARPEAQVREGDGTGDGTGDAAGPTVFATEAEAWPFRVTLHPAPCRDVMSGEAFETTVEIVWGPQRFDGCGRTLRQAW